MCDCEELDYDEFMSMAKALGTPVAEAQVQERAPIPMMVSAKRRK